MGRAKEILVKPINSKMANNFVKKHHYSGKVVQNSNLHFGAYLDNILHGVLSFGSPLDKRKVLPLVNGTLWNEMLELNRMALDDYLPKNSESRVISVCMKLIKKHYPHIKWVLSFADGTQCGDGTIYRASGFNLVLIKENKDLFVDENGDIVHSMTIKSSKKLRSKYGTFKNALVNSYKNPKIIGGFQLKYIYFLHPKEKENLTVPILPFSKIDEMGAGMYKGEKRKLCDNSVKEHISNSIEKVAV